jgi:hypothetical protein
MNSEYMVFWFKWLALSLVFFSIWGLTVLLLLWRIGSRL